MCSLCSLRHSPAAAIIRSLKGEWEFWGWGAVSSCTPTCPGYCRSLAFLKPMNQAWPSSDSFPRAPVDSRWCSSCPRLPGCLLPLTPFTRDSDSGWCGQMPRSLSSYEPALNSIKSVWVLPKMSLVRSSESVLLLTNGICMMLVFTGGVKLDTLGSTFLPCC